MTDESERSSRVANASSDVSLLMQRWFDAEPERFPLHFGGWRWKDHDPYQEPAKRLSYQEFAAAVETIKAHGFELIITSPKVGGAGSAEGWKVWVRDSQGVERTSVDSDPLAATVLVVVTLLSERGMGISRGQRSSLPVSFEGRPAVGQAHLASTSPADDLLRWARLEPARFEASESPRPRLIFRGGGNALLAPAVRAMVVMQFMPALSVFDAIAEKGWSLELTTRYEEPFTCRIQTGSRNAEASFPTVGPACVKAYLRALEGLN